MKLAKILAISFFVSGLVVALLLGGDSNYMFDSILTEKIYSHLQTAAESKAKHVETFLEMMKIRIIDFSSDGKIKDCSYILSNNLSGCTHEELSRHLTVNKLPVDENLYEVFVLNVDGEVMGKTNPEESFGTDFSTDLVFLEGKKDPYIKDVSYDEEYNRVSFSASAPIMRENKFVGVVVNRISIDILQRIVLDRTGLGETGEVYIVNEKKELISESRFLRGKNKGILTQIVDTENSEKCLSDIKEKIIDTEPHTYQNDPILFMDYRGENVLGAHDIVSEMGWCVLAEIDESEALGIPERQVVNKSIAVSFFSIIGLTLTGFVVGRQLDKKHVPEKKHVRIYKFNMIFIGMLVVALCVGYYFFATSVFSRNEMTNPYRIIIDLVSLGVALIIFAHSFRLANFKVRKYAITGSLLIIFGELIHVFFGRYEETLFYGGFYWLVAGAMASLGFLFLLFTYKEDTG